MEQNLQDRIYEWDDMIEKDGEGWVLLPAGDYEFQVTGFERARHPGSAKIPPCNKAILSLEVKGAQGTATVQYNLFLYSRQEWKLCQFFRAIGQRKHGEQLRMDWSRVTGATGRCKIGVRSWVGEKDGKEHESNEVLEFYPPEQSSRSAASGYTPGVF